MKFIKEIIRGLLIGIAGAAPGVSGGALAVSMGVYDKIIGAVTHITVRPRESLRILFPYALGIGMGMCGLAFIIEILFVRYPFAASMAFIGLILGGAPVVRRKAAAGDNRLLDYSAFLIVFCLMIILTIAEGEHGRGNVDLSLVYSNDLSTWAAAAAGLFCAGLIGAAATVIPGVSGTMLLMMMGYYQPVLSAFNRLQTGLLTGNLLQAAQEQRALLPYGAGMAAGIFLCAHMVERLLKDHESLTYSMILALILSSPIVILRTIPFGTIPAGEMAAGILLAAAGSLAVAGADARDVRES